MQATDCRPISAVGCLFVKTSIAVHIMPAATTALHAIYVMQATRNIQIAIMCHGNQPTA